MRAIDDGADTRGFGGGPFAGRTLPELLLARYRDASFTAGMDAHAVRAMLDHRSVRSYRADPVPDEAVATAVAAAQSASTSSNLQLWSLVTVRDAPRKSRLSVLAGTQRHIDEAPLLLVWLADLSRARRVAESEGAPAEGLDYLEMFVTAAVDAALAAQNAAVAFEALGYGTCYIGSMRSHPTEVAAELGLPREVFPIFGMTVGRPRPEAGEDVKPRLPQAAVVMNERYDASSLAENVGAYDEALRAFQREQRMADTSWMSKVSQRIRTPAALKNRDKLKGYLREMGFALK